MKRVPLWLAATPLVAALAAVAAFYAAPAIETELRREVQARHETLGGSSLRRLGARVDVEGRDVAIIATRPMSDAVRAQAERSAREVGGVRRAETRTVPPVAMSPFRFTARRDGKSLTLDGGVPSAELQDSLVEALRAGAEPFEVDDRLEVVSSAPDGFDAVAQLALTMLGRLPRGEAVLTERALSIKGAAPDHASYEAVLESAKAIPAGYEIVLAGLLPPIAEPFTWTAEKSGNAIVLSGFVPSEDARRDLIAATRRLDSGAVVDRMQVARGLPAGVAFAASARFGVDAVARLTRGRASLEGSRLSVEGGSPARDVLADLERRLRGEAPAGLSLGPVTLSPVPASPYTFSARRGSAGLELTGYVPSAGDRASLREAAQRRFVGDPILDKLHLAEGAPPDFPTAARLSLEWLAELAEGEARIVDGRLTIEGQSLYDGVTARTVERVRTGLPSGWVGQASLRTRPAERLLEASLCEDLVTDVLKREPIEFQPDNPTLSEPGRRSLDKVVAVARRCGPMRLAVRVAAEAGPDAAASLALASRRAAAIVDVVQAGAADVRATGEADGPKSGGVSSPVEVRVLR